MKEARYFYVPQASVQNELPADEAVHALRVLRLASGDEMFLMEGDGGIYRAKVTMTSSKHCFYEIVETLHPGKAWLGNIHLAIAPTKMMERIEWMAETNFPFSSAPFPNVKLSTPRVWTRLSFRP